MHGDMAGAASDHGPGRCSRLRLRGDGLAGAAPARVATWADGAEPKDLAPEMRGHRQFLRSFVVFLKV